MALLVQGGALDVGNESFQPLVVEPQSVDERVGLGQTKHARLGVAGLGQGCDGADFNKTKTHGAQAIDALCIFIEPGGQAHPVGKRESGQLNWIIDPTFAISQLQRRALGARQGVHGEFVGRFGIHAEYKRTGEGVGDERHG